MAVIVLICLVVAGNHSDKENYFPYQWELGDGILYDQDPYPITRCHRSKRACSTDAKNAARKEATSTTESGGKTRTKTVTVPPNSSALVNTRTIIGNRLKAKESPSIKRLIAGKDCFALFSSGYFSDRPQPPVSTTSTSKTLLKIHYLSLSSSRPHMCAFQPCLYRISLSWPYQKSHQIVASNEVFERHVI